MEQSIYADNDPKTGDDFYIISYNFVIVVSVKWGKVTINPLHSLFSMLCWPASHLRLLLILLESLEIVKVLYFSRENRFQI
jgi:hypothetical protein